MIRKLFSSMFVMAAVISFVAADEFQGTITKVDGDLVTVQRYKKAEKGKKGKGEKDGSPVTMSAKGAKIIRGKLNPDTMKVEDGDPIEGGLKAELFTKIEETKGVNATIVTDGEGKDARITKIRTFARKKVTNAN
jgi:hypothetical protein